jgi:hypothetical protein
MITESLEHFANAAAIAGESSAVPFDEAYFDGIMQALLLGGGHDDAPDTKLIVKVTNHSREAKTIIVKILMRN